MENFVAPRVRSESDKSRVSCIRVLAYALAAEAVGNELGQIHPWCSRILARDFVGIQLVQGIQSKNLNSSQRIEARRRQNSVHLAFCLLCPRISIVKGKGDWIALAVQPHVIDGPAIDSNGCNALGSASRAGA